jgi:hypothetical protein
MPARDFRLLTLQRQQFAEFFPFFFEDPPAAPESDLSALREERYNMRRFSGGADLERGRYFAMLDEGDVNDVQRIRNALGRSPLVGELLAYAHPWTPDWTSVFDLGAVPAGAFDQVLDAEQRELVAAAQRNVIAVFDRPLRSVEGAEATPRERGYLFPYEVTTIERESAFDLRRPETLDWLVSALNDDFPNAAFPLIADHSDEEDQTLFVENIATPADRERFLSSVDLPLSRGLRGIRQALDGLGDLLVYLLNPSLGGTHITDMIATLALDSEADCIIYPSARADCGVSYGSDGPATWWGWNLVDLSGATSRYTGCLFVVGRPERFYGWPDLTVILNENEETESSAATLAGQLRGWAVDGLTQNTSTAVQTRRWIRALERSAMNVEIALDVERTPRRGRHSERPRKPKRYERLSYLRAELACHDVDLDCHVLAIDGRSRGELTVGELLARLCSSMALYRNEEPVPTVYSGGWFLLQSPEPTTFVLMCPICGTSDRFERELDIVRMGHCGSCRYGSVLDEEPWDAGARAFAAVDDGLDLMWPDAGT